MKLENFECEQKYLGGMRFESYSLRKYEMTITSKDHILKGKKFFKEVHTPRLDFMSWGDPEVTYYLNDTSKIYKSIKWLLKALLRQ